MLFMGGPCTNGPGQVTSIKLSDTMRSFIDIQKANSNSTFIQKATKYYDALAGFAASINIVIDMFITSLDQIGLM